MKSITYYGYKCPKCNSTVDIGVIVGNDVIACPRCKAIMEPNKEGKACTANAHCKKCNATFGIINSDRCPRCGGNFE